MAPHSGLGKEEGQAGLFQVVDVFHGALVSYRDERREQRGLVGHRQDAAQHDPLQDESLPCVEPFPLDPTVQPPPWYEFSGEKEV